jgi:hypothetical protein
MIPASPSRHSLHSLNDVARRLAPHLRIISASRPTPVLRDRNVLALARDAEAGRRAVLALESIEPNDEQLGTVVMGAVPGTPERAEVDDAGELSGRVDPEGVGRQVVPRALLGGLIGAIVGAVVVGGGALLLGASGWGLAGAAAAGAILFAVFGAIWYTFAGLGGSDAYRQTFVDAAASDLTIVSLHTDDESQAVAARSRLESLDDVVVITVDRFGQRVDSPPSSSNTQ